MILESVLHSKDGSTLPNFAVSVYGGPSQGILDTEIRKVSLPMFICAASDDQLKLAPKSVLSYNKLLEAGHPAELHIYEKGGHGF